MACLPSQRGMVPYRNLVEPAATVGQLKYIVLIFYKRVSLNQMHSHVFDACYIYLAMFWFENVV
jgi:preprotein translocase subunit SecF